MLENIIKIWNDLGSSFIGKFLAALIYALIGDYVVAYTALVVLMIADFLTGVWAARIEKSYSGTQARQKTLAKFGVYLLVAACSRAFDALLFDVQVEILGALMIKAALVYLAGTEFISVMENLKRTGHPIRIPLIESLREYLNPKKP